MGAFTGLVLRLHLARAVCLLDSVPSHIPARLIKSTAVVRHSQHNSNPNSAPRIDKPFALGCVIYNNARYLPSLAKKTMSKTSTNQVLAFLV